MPLEVQSGDVADRLRRFFRLVGRIPTALDETLVPTAVLQNLDQPPWRSGPTDFEAWVVKGATAAELSAVGLTHPPALGGRTVVERITVRNDGGAAALYSFTITSYSYVLGFAGRVQAPDVERMPPPITGAGAIGQLGIYTASWHTGGAMVGTQIGHISVPAGDTRVAEMRVTLAPGWILMVWQEVVNLGVRASFGGTYYPEL